MRHGSELISLARYRLAVSSGLITFPGGNYDSGGPAVRL